VSRARTVVADPARLVLRAGRAYRDRLPRIRVGAARGAPKVYYLTPDCDVPSGGVQVMYRHVDRLNAAGVDAAVLHSRRGYRCTWFEHETPVTDTHRTRLAADDVLVVTEIDAGVLPSLPRGLRQVVFNQSSHLTFRRHREQVARHFATSDDVLAMLAVSDHSAQVLRYAFPRLDVRRLHLGLDDRLFRPSEAAGGRTITYMPRRAGTDAELVIEMLRSRGALSGWEVRPLHGLSHAETAAALRSSTLFLHFTYQEGFGLPAAEAMACGNLVVGFHGFGGAELFRPEFSRPVPTGDVLAFARTVEEVLEQEERQPGWCRSLGLAASGHVRSTYTAERERADLVSFFSEALASGTGASSGKRAAGRAAEQFMGGCAPALDLART